MKMSLGGVSLKGFSIYPMRSFSRPLGRPKLQVDIEDIEYLRSLRLPWIKIAQSVDLHYTET